MSKHAAQHTCDKGLGQAHQQRPAVGAASVSCTLLMAFQRGSLFRKTWIPMCWKSELNPGNEWILFGSFGRPFVGYSGKQTFMSSGL